MRNQLEGKRDPIVRDYHNQLDELVEAVLSQVRSCCPPVRGSSAVYVEPNDQESHCAHVLMMCDEQQHKVRGAVAHRKGHSSSFNMYSKRMHFPVCRVQCSPCPGFPCRNSPAVSQ